MRRSRHHTQKTDIHGQIVGAVSIRERPRIARGPGGARSLGGRSDVGSSNSEIATLVERQTRYLMLVKLAAKDTETVIDALIKNTRSCPRSSTSR